MSESLKTVGIYLAAGTSSRMGVDKRYLPLGNRPLGSWALHEALHSMLGNVVVVGRSNDSFEWLSPKYENKSKLHIARTFSHTICQSHSLQTGFDKAISLQAQAVLVMLADQPFVTRKHINQIIKVFHYTYTKKPLFIASKYQDITIPPILLTKSLFPEIKLLTGDQGAKTILKSQKENGLFILFNDSLWTIDVDTPEIYNLVCKKHFAYPPF
ncbi:nucleotidyltransferase family protein [Brevibacillus laterosporus]|uniref:nucleotidyltransferase family protein n=1 Tax=Brevibacillus laterosporus TaxID=1465 RepID=UPI0022787B1B|nr:nucleotidyltransferase family protein [Brevibacillus laterosporus]